MAPSDPPIDPDKELTGLDKMIEVIALLVLKFGRATTALIAVGVLLIFCVVALIVSMAQTIVLRNQMRDLLDRQELLVKSQVRLEKTMTSTQLVLTDTLHKVVETQAKIETVAEATPKITVDSKTGKPRLVMKPEALQKKVEFNLTAN